MTRKAEARQARMHSCHEDLVVGRAIAVVWPLDRQHRLAIPDTFDSVPSGSEPAPDAATITAGPEASC